MIKFEQTGRRPDGEKLYRLIIDDEVRRENMTLDEVIAEIHRSDDSKARNASHECPRVAIIEARHTPQPLREAAAERRRMARREPGEHR